MRHPCGVPCVAQPDRPPHKLARSAARPRAQTYSSDTPCLVCATRRCTGEGKAKFKNQSFVCGRKAPTYSSNDSVGTCAHPTTTSPPPCRGRVREGVEFFPCAPPRYFTNKRRFRRALSELRGEARFVCLTRASCAAPLVCEISREPQGAAHRGRLLWVTFLGKTRKVTSCRATPDGLFKAIRRNARWLLRPTLAVEWLKISLLKWLGEHARIA